MAEIRAAAAQLQAALAAEESSGFESAEPKTVAHAGILPGRDPGKLDGGGTFGKITRFPQVYYVMAGLAAACFAILVARFELPTHISPAKKHYQEVALSPTPVVERDSNISGGVVVQATSQPAPAKELNSPLADGRLQVPITLKNNESSAGAVVATLPAEPRKIEGIASIGTMLAGKDAGYATGTLTGPPTTFSGSEEKMRAERSDCGRQR